MTHVDVLTRFESNPTYTSSFPKSKRIYFDSGFQVVSFLFKTSIYYQRTNHSISIRNSLSLFPACCFSSSFNASIISKTSRKMKAFISDTLNIAELVSFAHAMCFRPAQGAVFTWWKSSFYIDLKFLCLMYTSVHGYCINWLIWNLRVSSSVPSRRVTSLWVGCHHNQH